MKLSYNSYATLTINGIFMGLYWMKEEYDDQFIYSRFGNAQGIHSRFKYITDELSIFLF
jgi:hypothetical protein